MDQLRYDWSIAYCVAFGGSRGGWAEKHELTSSKWWELPVAITLCLEPFPRARIGRYLNHLKFSVAVGMPHRHMGERCDLR